MNPTKYREINELLQQLLLQVQSILTDKLVGMYVGGSLSTQSFHYETSDIDCYVITENILSNDAIPLIKEIHNKFYSSKLPYAEKIEASYIPQKDLLNFNPSGIRPYFNEGRFYMAEYGSSSIIELHVLREHAITMVGPDIKYLIRAISTQNLRTAILANLHQYWKITLDDFSKFSRSDYQVFSILTMCRTLYSLETGSITSKIGAAQWALLQLDNQWKSLIEQALTWKPKQEMNKLEETQQFVRYVLDKSHDYK